MKGLKALLAVFLAFCCFVGVMNSVFAVSEGEQSILNNLSESIYFNEEKTYGVDMPEYYVSFVQEKLESLNSSLTAEEIDAVNTAIDAAQQSIYDYAQELLTSCYQKHGETASWCIVDAQNLTVYALQDPSSELRTALVNSIVDLAAGMDVMVQINGKGIEYITITDNRPVPTPTPEVTPTPEPEILVPVEIDTVVPEEDGSIAASDTLMNAIVIAAANKGQLVDEADPSKGVQTNEVVIPVELDSEAETAVVETEIFTKAAESSTTLTFDMGTYSMSFVPEANDSVLDLAVAIVPVSKEHDTEAATPDLLAAAEEDDFAKEILEAEEPSMVMNFAHSGDLPGKTTKVTVNVAEYFEDGETVYIYHINPHTKKLEAVKNSNGQEGFVVTGGMISMKIESCSEYVFTSAQPTTDLTPIPTPTPTPTPVPVVTPSENSTILKNTGAMVE